MTRTLYLLVSGLALWLVACSAPAPEGGQIDAPPMVSSSIPTEHQFIRASAESRPAWIDTEPEDTAEMLYFVGLSNYNLSEKEARDEALRDAISKYATYTGVDVSLMDDVVRSLQGKESEVLDATVSGQSRSTLSTDSRVSRVKARSWYYETFRSTRGDRFVGQSLKYWVKVEVPVDEYERVQTRQREREAAAIAVAQAKEDAQLAARLQERQQAEQAIENLLADYRQNRRKAEEALQQGDVLLALQIVEGELVRLSEAKQGLVNRGGAFEGRTGEIDRALRDAGLVLVPKVLNTVEIDVGRFNSYCFPPGARDQQIDTWVWSRFNGAPQAVRGLPLVMEGVTTGQKTLARTDTSGRAVFHLPTVEDSGYRISVDPAAGQLQTLSPKLVNGLCSLENRLFISHSGDPLELSTKGAVTRLFQGPSARPLPVKRVLLGGVSYGETGQGGEFALAIKRMLGQHLTAIEGLEVIQPRKQSAEAISNAVRTRGIGAKETIGGGALQAHLNNADAALATTYAIYGPEVAMTFALQAENGKLLQQITATVAKEQLPPGMQIVPKRVEKPIIVSAGGGGAIRLDIASHLGDGQTYQEGETISYFVSSDRDAYLLLVYQDAAGHLIQILPNRFSGSEKFRAGNFIEVPGASAGYEFVIEEPFGVEHVWAFASDSPFPRLAGQELDNGLVLLDENRDEIFGRLRRLARQDGVAYGEAQSVITTVAGKNRIAQQ